MNRQLKIVIDNKIPFINGVFEEHANVVYLPGNEISAHDIINADALLIRTRTRCDSHLLENSTVKFIASATIGFDHIDQDYCREKNIAWTNAPGCNSSSVEQYIISALLYLALRKGYELKSLTLGIIGVGNVGKKVARAASALGCKVLLNDPPRAKSEGSRDFEKLENLLAHSDIITMHVPLIEEGPYKTRGLADKGFFSKMKSRAVFINTSRGEVVNEKDLKEAAETNKLSDVILDVYTNEPNVDQKLLSLVTLGTPHIAGYSSDGKAMGTQMSVQAISKHFGLSLNSWKPTQLPFAGNREIFIDASDNKEPDLISEVYNSTYDIRDDHDNFMQHVNDFEKLRGDYRVRREPPAYKVRVFNDDGKYRNILEELGFNVIGDSCF